MLHKFGCILSILFVIYHLWFGSEFGRISYLFGKRYRAQSVILLWLAYRIGVATVLPSCVILSNTGVTNLFETASYLLCNRLMRRGTSLICTSEIKIFLNLLSIISLLIFVNVKTLIMLMLFLEQAAGDRLGACV